MVTAVINSLSACGALKNWCVRFHLKISYPSVTCKVWAVGGLGETRRRGSPADCTYCINMFAHYDKSNNACPFKQMNEKVAPYREKHVYLFNRNIPTVTYYIMGLKTTDFPPTFCKTDYLYMLHGMFSNLRMSGSEAKLIFISIEF